MTLQFKVSCVCMMSRIKQMLKSSEIIQANVKQRGSVLMITIIIIIIHCCCKGGVVSTEKTTAQLRVQQWRVWRVSTVHCPALVSVSHLHWLIVVFFKDDFSVFLYICVWREFIRPLFTVSLFSCCASQSLVVWPFVRNVWWRYDVTAVSHFYFKHTHIINTKIRHNIQIGFIAEADQYMSTFYCESLPWIISHLRWAYIISYTIYVYANYTSYVMIWNLLIYFQLFSVTNFMTLAYLTKKRKKKDLPSSDIQTNFTVMAHLCI